MPWDGAANRAQSGLGRTRTRADTLSCPSYPLSMMHDDDVDLREGLYDPAFEHDSCGVGLVCNIKGRRSHDIVQQGLEILRKLEHRGGCGADERTGDGAGILMQLPHRFLVEVCQGLGITLPDEGWYGVGMAFLPTDAHLLAKAKQLVETSVRDEGQNFLGWRKVPTRAQYVGDVARLHEPSIWQFFVGATLGPGNVVAFERKLLIIRKVIGQAFKDQLALPREKAPYVCTLSAQTIVYKGMLTVNQLPLYYEDLSDSRVSSAVAMVHSRFSTNTLPMWSLAQPFRLLCHNGEINTLRGNFNWMRARESQFVSERFGEDIEKIRRVLSDTGSDSSILDNALELLTFTGRSLPHAIMMMVPEAWQGHDTMDDAKRAFYEYHACLMEPWDGPATIPFTDGRYVGAVLDRNGLRPSRYTVTHDDRLILASETGVLNIAPENVKVKGRLEPGRMLLADLRKGKLLTDRKVKARISSRQPYRYWLDRGLRTPDQLPDVAAAPAEEPWPLLTQQKLYGYTLEDVRLLLEPMGELAKEALGSMGDDTPLAVLSDQPRLLYDYFKQLFAQVTNPPLDAIREALVTSLMTHLGPDKNLFQLSAAHCQRIRLEHPILDNATLHKIKHQEEQPFRAATISILYRQEGGGPEGLATALESICKRVTKAIEDGHTLLVLSDRGADASRVPIPALLATSAVHQHLIRTFARTRCGLILESAEPREVHHMCLLLGYGVGAINPYLALDTIHDLHTQGLIKGVSAAQAQENYIQALCAGILKVLSKMGISTLQSYRGAQVFEAVGIQKDLVDRYFWGTPSRIEGIGLEAIAASVEHRVATAFPEREVAESAMLHVGGKYQWRRGGEYHTFNPFTIAHLQHAVRSKHPDTYTAFAQAVNEQNVQLGTLRGLLALTSDRAPVPLDEVEPWTEIVKRFKTGAMSYGSLSQEAHETLAEAMNAIGGRSNTGEGGESPERYAKDSPKRSRIKQVASGRFGVTLSYLVSADEIQIKMAQGAKPGEGGQLPGAKVYPWIAKVRNSMPYVGLISPPPHHDIYSIEDLAQLIHDLKNANPQARISVKLVSEAGVGTIAAGVAKAKAEVILISGHDGGTGAAPLTSLKHAGLPWEMGLAETHQTLVRNGLRNRVTLECDGQLKTGRDVLIAALLGAQEFGFATAPLVSMGCIMMRKCHLNTCPVGIATQDPVLRQKFMGTAEHVINYFHFVAEEVRKLLAQLGYRTLKEVVGRTEHLRQLDTKTHPRARGLDLSALLYKPEVPKLLRAFDVPGQDHGLEHALDQWLIAEAEPALAGGGHIVIDTPIANTNRTVGTMLSGEIIRRHGANGLPENAITVVAKGSCGQSFGAFGAPGLTLSVQGDANDYFGKGLCGARLIIRPPEHAAFRPEENVIIGNVALYGATRGEAFISGKAGERFAVRNSGALAVVEGIGDHGCEYMTGGRVVVLGPSGRNFAAGMSGGIAYVYDPRRSFADARCNLDMVEVGDLASSSEAESVKLLIERHAAYTGSPKAQQLLGEWEKTVYHFRRIIPTEYRLALERTDRMPVASAAASTKDAETVV